MPSAPEFSYALESRCLFVGFLELAEKGVSALGRVVQSVFCRFFASPKRFHLFVDDVACLDEAAETQTLGVRGRGVQAQLLDRRVGTRVLAVEALLLGQLVSRGGDRNITGFLVPHSLDFS